MVRRKPIPGRWYIEDDKNVRLYCHGVRDGRVDLSYRPDSPIAVGPTVEDFRLFWTLVPEANAWRRVLKPAF